MSKNSKPQSVTIVGGRNVAPPPPKKPKTKTPKTAGPEKTTQPEKEPENE